MDERLTIIKTALEDKIAKNIKIFDTRELTPMFDYMVIADAANPNQLDAMIDGVQDELAKSQIYPKTEGKKNTGWVLLDYSDIIVHLFTTEARSFYDLERIWQDAKEIN